jgi:hypothetical protein
LIARKALPKTQKDIFLSRGQPLFLLKTLVITGLKLSVDIIAAIPGFNWLFFKRMSHQVPDSVRKEFMSLWDRTRNRDGTS